MKKNQLLCGTVLLGVATFGLSKSGWAQVPAPSQVAPRLPFTALSSTVLSPAQIIATAQETSKAQLQALTPQNRNALDWASGAMWAGIAEFATISNSPLEFDAVQQLGERVKWTPRTTKKDPFLADDDAMGQAFLADYARRRDLASLTPTRMDMDALVERLKAAEKEPRPVVLTWCDTLFMAPPVMAQLSSLTGDRKYLDAMDKEWWKTAALLYDPQEHLFFRDRGFLKRLEANGQKMFWSRGNGWVLAGLARVLTYMPRDYVTRPRYEQMFREMSAKLLTLQGRDGMWRASLLHPEAFPAPESSGTAFYCYAFAWGINNGLLPRETYASAAGKAWRGLVAHRRADKLPGFVQPVGNAPAPSKAEDTHLYATGGFLLAATEMAKLTSVGLPLHEVALVSQQDWR
ncbi:MAG: glycoside hydrolase family 88 protein [Armatimonadetes bacterium]|nr:glycoside hydrolase family 88 protein [Armatimonadota bacterium]